MTQQRCSKCHQLGHKETTCLVQAEMFAPPLRTALRVYAVMDKLDVSCVCGLFTTRALARKWMRAHPMRTKTFRIEPWEVYEEQR